MVTAQEFTKATGFTVAVVPVDSVAGLAKTNADVVVGLDGADALQASASGSIAAVAPQDTVTLSGTAVEGAAAAVAYGRDDVSAYPRAARGPGPGLVVGGARVRAGSCLADG